MDSVDKVQPVEDRGEAIPVDGRPMPRKSRAKPSLPAVAGLRPRQVLAAMMLAEGRMAKEIALHIEVSPETVSRWKSEPAFQALTHELLRDSIDATRLGLVSLFSESIVHLRGLMCGLDDDKALKAISLLFSKAAPVLSAISAEGRPHTANTAGAR